MRALTVAPGQAGSLQLDTRPKPRRDGGHLLVESIALGVCGTDSEIVAGHYGWAPPHSDRLVLGHETLGRVIEAAPECDYQPGDFVVGIVRRPDPVPCPACGGGEWDMCANGLYSERGIKARDGYGSEYYLLEPDFAVKVDPSLGLCGVLVEPASVLAKAWDHIEGIGSRTRSWSPRTVLVTGAGAVGLLGALMGKMRGLDVHVYDRNQAGLKPQLVAALGATYHCAPGGPPGDFKPDIILECTGAPAVILDSLTRTGAGGIVCLVGLSGARPQEPFDAAGFNRLMVLENDVVFGTVNANRAHYQAAAQTLARADINWLRQLISRRVPLERWRDAFEPAPGDVKVVVHFDHAVL